MKPQIVEQATRCGIKIGNGFPDVCGCPSCGAVKGAVRIVADGWTFACPRCRYAVGQFAKPPGERFKLTVPEAAGGSVTARARHAKSYRRARH